MTKKQFGSFEFDPTRGVLRHDGEPVALGQRGAALLDALLTADGRTVSKTRLMDAAWPDMAVEESNLSVQIAALRKLLGATPSGGNWITTIPRIGYRFDATPNGEGEQHLPAALGTPVADPAARPRILVIPFHNMSDDPEQDYLADGITEDIITALARFRWFQVIARNTSFVYKDKPVDRTGIADALDVAYLVQGSIRKSGQRIRISAQLIDTASGAHIWAERYDLEMTDLFAIQDDIAGRIAGATEPEMLRVDAALAASRHTGNMAAWDLVRRGTWNFHQVTRTTHHRARRLFCQARDMDPLLPEAHIWLARVNAGLLAYDWSDDPATDRDDGLEAARRALHLDDKNPYSHYAFAIINNFAGDPAQAAQAAARAVALSPSFAIGHLALGMAQFFDGRALDSIASLEEGLRLNPFDPQNFAWFNLLALAKLFSGQPADALQSALQAFEVRPDWRPALETVTCCHAALGEWEEASRFVRQMAECKSVSGDTLAPLRRRKSPWIDHMAALLRRAADVDARPPSG